MADAGAVSQAGLKAKRGRRKAPALATLAEIGRAILQAELDQDALCELIHRLAGRIVPTDTFQLGLFDGDIYRIKVWVKEGRRQPPATFVIPEGQGLISAFGKDRYGASLYNDAAYAKKYE